MPKHSNTYTVIFISIVAVVCSLLLSTAASSLKKRQQINVALDKKKNILKSFGALTPGLDIETFYKTNIEAIVVDHQGNPVEGNPDNIDPVKEEKTKANIEERYFPLYILKEEGVPVAYTIPIIGKGLWSTLYGYLALGKDLNTVKGITFYKHGETPGLGAEIEADWFQNNFKDKKILNSAGDLISVSVVKGAASDFYSDPQLAHYVDGISGATITSTGVTKMLMKHLTNYKSCFATLREKGG